MQQKSTSVEMLLSIEIYGIYFVNASCTATAQATLAPTMGLLPNKFERFELS